MPGFREEKRLTRSVSYWKLWKGTPGMSSFTKSVISFKTSIVHFTELVNTLEQAIFPTLSHKAPQFLCNLTVSSSREDMSQSGSSIPFNKERNPCPHCGVALSVSEFCKLCTINKAARPANQGGACCYFGAGYGSRTRLHSLGSCCTTDVRILRTGAL